MSLEINQLSFNYRSRQVLSGVNFSALKGEVVSLVGPNGAGKSTLLKCINKILKPCSGSVRVDGKDVAPMDIKKISRIFGYVPQTALSTFPATVFDTVLLGRRPFMNWTVGRENRDKVYDILVRMKLDHMALRQFSELSGGEQQKTLVARALVQAPRVLLLDEPTSSLDLHHQLDVMDHVVSIVKEQGICAVMAIHDLNLAALYSDRMVFLKNGQIRENGSPGTVLCPDIIQSVYGVKATVNHYSQGPHIVPLRKGALCFENEAEQTPAVCQKAVS